MEKVELKEALQIAGNDPNGLFATSLRKTIETGSLDQVAWDQGIDLSAFGRKKRPPMGQRITQAIPNLVENTVDRAKETVQDVVETGKNIVDTVDRGIERSSKVVSEGRSGEVPVGSSTLRAAGSGFGTLSRIIGDLTIGAGKLLLNEDQEQEIASAVSDVAGKVIDTPAVKQATSWWNNFSEENPQLAEDLVASGEVASLFLDVAGGYGGTKAAAPLARAGETALDAATDTAIRAQRTLSNRMKNVFTQAGDNVEDVVRNTPVSETARSIRRFDDDALEEALKSTKTGRTPENTSNIREALSGEDGLLTVADKRRLLKIDSELGNRYINALEASNLDDTAPKLFTVAVEDTEEAVRNYRRAISQTGNEVGEIKKKLAQASAPVEDVRLVKDEIVSNLESKGLKLTDEGFVFVEGSNSPFTVTDLNAINDDILRVLDNIENSQSMEQVLLGMQRLDNKINYSRSADVSNSLQGVSKTLRARLKKIRDSQLTPQEQDVFNQYSEAISFADEFLKSDNKIQVLMKRFNTMTDRKSVEFAREIERVTGIDIADYARLVQILTDTTAGNSSQRTLLRQYMGETAEAVTNLSPVSFIGAGARALAKDFIDIKKLDEIKKAINFGLPNAN